MIQMFDAGLRGSVLLAACLATSLPAASQSRAPEPQPWALVGVRTSMEEDAPTRTLLLRGGRIADVLDASEELPEGWRVLDGEGLLALPAFVDAWTTTGCEMPEREVRADRPVQVDANVRIDMRAANRKGIQPSFRAVEVLDLSDEIGGKHRAQGFAALAAAPSGQILAGKSVLASTHDAATRDVVLRSELFHHAAFSASGPGYPGTLMGFHAQLRQFFLDVRHHRELERRHQQGRPGSRPPWDEELLAGRALIEGERLLCEANLARDIARWIRLADELGLSIAICGGREAWKMADELAERGIPVYLDLDWSDEPEDESEDEPEEEAEEEGEESEEGEGLVEGGAEEESEEGDVGDEGDAWLYEVPEGVKAERRRLWEEERDGALVLVEAGVKLAFCSGEESAKDLMGNVRKLVESGFPGAVALEALTSWPAEMLGAGGQIGSLEAGVAASVGLWTGDPTGKDGQLAWLFVDGFPYEFEVKEKKEGSGEAPAEGVDLTGEWEFATDSEDEQEPAEVSLTMEEDGSVTGTMKVTLPQGGTATSELSGQLEGTSLTLEGTLSVQGFEIDLSFEAEVSADELKGRRELKSEMFESEDDFVGTRLPDSGRSGAEGSAR